MHFKQQQHFKAISTFISDHCDTLPSRRCSIEQQSLAEQPRTMQLLREVYYHQFLPSEYIQVLNTNGSSSTNMLKLMPCMCTLLEREEAREEQWCTFESASSQFDSPVWERTSEVEEEQETVTRAPTPPPPKFQFVTFKSEMFRKSSERSVTFSDKIELV